MKTNSISSSSAYTLINACVLTMDDHNTYYPNGFVSVQDHKIMALGHQKDCLPNGQVIDMEGKLLLPGFINTHTHSPSPLIRSMADDLPLMEWLHEGIWPVEKHMTAQMAYDASRLSFLEFLNAGVTTFADQYYFMDSIAKAARESGLRAFLAPTVFSEGSPESKDTIDVAVNFIEKYKGHESETLIYPCIGPHAPYSCNEDTLKTVAKIAEKYQVITHIHISETIDENKQIEQRYGVTPTQFLNRTGLLDNPTLAAHCIHLNQNDIEIFKTKKVAVAYKPVSNLKLVSGIMPLKAMWEKDIVVSIGTDGAQSNNSLDLLNDMKIGNLVQKQWHNDARFCTARQSLRMLTIEGAKALGMSDKIGSLEIGKLADLIAIDYALPNVNPYHTSDLSHLYSLIIYSASGKNVSDVMVNGRFLMRNHSPLFVNPPEVYAHAQSSADEILKAAHRL